MLSYNKSAPHFVYRVQDRAFAGIGWLSDQKAGRLVRLDYNMLRAVLQSIRFEAEVPANLKADLSGVVAVPSSTSKLPLSNRYEKVQSMKPVTTGPGISGTFADNLETLICDLRTESRNQRWHLYIKVLRSPEYSFRVYAPDGHTELHTIIKTTNTVQDIREILMNEAGLWQSRVQASAGLAPVGDAASPDQ